MGIRLSRFYRRSMMKTIWNKTIEGRQYWVQVKGKSMKLEMVSDPVSELVGGGYSIDLPERLEDDPETIKELKNIFSADEILEIVAFSRALKKIKRRDLDDRSENFNRIYYLELEKIISGKFKLDGR
jgi:hypothetical protein